MRQNDMINISFIAAHKEEALLYGAGYDQNLLFCWNMETKEIQNLGAFREFGNFKGDNIIAVIKYGERLFCFSRISYEIVAWHLEEKTFIHYCPEDRTGEMEDIRSVCRVGNDVWMLQNVAASSAMVFSMESGRFARYTTNIDLKQHFHISEITSFAHENSVVAGDWLWRCIPGTDALLGLDTKTLETGVVKFQIPDTFYTISNEEGWIYILGVSGKHVIAWNPDTKEKIVWDTGYEGIKDRPFREVIKVGNRLFLLPCFEKKIFCYEIHETKVCLICKLEYPAEFERMHDTENRSMFLGSVFMNKNLLYLFPMAGNGMLSLNTDSMKTSLFPIQVSKDEYLNSQTCAGKAILENQIRLEDYMDFVIARKTGTEQKNGNTCCAGKKCWEGVKQFLSREYKE